MKENEFPIGHTLVSVLVKEDREFGGNDLCLDEVYFIFSEATILLQPITDTDEVQITSVPTIASTQGMVPVWCEALLGQTLRTIWLCDNSQGYQDQVILAFGQLHPTIAFVAEGSVLKVFVYQQVKKSTGSTPLTFSAPETTRV
jgi:Family of unknown function (DUF6334)